MHIAKSASGDVVQTAPSPPFQAAHFLHTSTGFLLILHTDAAKMSFQNHENVNIIKKIQKPTQDYDNGINSYLNYDNVY